MKGIANARAAAVPRLSARGCAQVRRARATALPRLSERGCAPVEPATAAAASRLRAHGGVKENASRGGKGF